RWAAVARECPLPPTPRAAGSARWAAPPGPPRAWRRTPRASARGAPTSGARPGALISCPTRPWIHVLPPFFALREPSVGDNLASMGFVHLPCHSEYSLLDGANRIENLITRAQELEQPALAITDHGNLHAAWEFQEKARKAKLRPIIGMEAYVAPGDRRVKARS